MLFQAQKSVIICYRSNKKTNIDYNEIKLDLRKILKKKEENLQCVCIWKKKGRSMPKFKKQEKTEEEKEKEEEEGEKWHRKQN